MARVTVEDCLEAVVDQFALVHLATARYRQLHRGAPRLVDNKNKDVVCALREIASGSVRFREDVHEVLFENKKPVLSVRLQEFSEAEAAGTSAPTAELDGLDDNNTPLI